MNVSDLKSPCQKPCTKTIVESSESDYQTESELEECYFRPSDSQFYPCIIPVHNGVILRIQPEFVHAALAGISIKHCYGKCFQEVESENIEEKIEDIATEEQFYLEPEEYYGYDLLHSGQRLQNLSSYNSRFHNKSFTQHYDYPDQHSSFKKSENLNDELPICMKEKINFRNSFWNIHKPELCKLTWSQKYVSTMTVTEHLHNHLTSHGTLCVNFHEEKLRFEMLDKELCEYGRLKTIVPPQKIPPDEQLFNFKMEDSLKLKCKGIPVRKSVLAQEDRFLNLSDDDLTQSEKNIHRSKEEFCLTIGRPVKKVPLKKSLSLIERHDFLEPESPFNPEEEESTSSFGFDWLQYEPEEYYDEEITDDTSIDFDSIIEPFIDNCPPLMIDDFCRAVAKADFSDLRCNPDDF